MQQQPRQAESLADRQIVNVRLLDAPRSLVWRVWTDPKHITHWWGPRGFSTTTITMDLRPGGVWRFVMHGPDGTDYGNRVTFLQVEEPERLVFRHEGTDEATKEITFITTVTFAAKGEQTEVTLSAEFPSAALRDHVAEKYGAVEGGRQTLERLAEHVADLHDAARGTYSLRVTRVIEAPRQLVWDAWTKPEHTDKWGPVGYTVEQFNDPVVRPGGTWRAVLRPPGKDRELWQGGVYREVKEPERLVFTFAWDDEHGRPGAEMLITLTFEDLGGGKTRLTLRQDGLPTLAERDGHEGGWGEALDVMKAHLEKVARFL